MNVRWIAPRSGACICALLIALLALAPASSGATVDEAAQGAVVTIHHRFCPDGYDETNFYEDCHDNVGWVGIPFFVTVATHDMCEMAATRDDGNATFTDIPPGRYQVGREIFFQEIEAPLVFCSDADAPGVELLSATNPKRIELQLSAGDHVICDWYSTPRVGWTPGRYPLPVRVYACERDPGGIGIAMGGLPDGCGGIAGVAVRITTLDDKPLGHCTTGLAGGCEIPTPFAFHVRAEMDPATFPEGYRPTWNARELWVYTEFAAAIFVLLPVPE